MRKRPPSDGWVTQVNLGMDLNSKALSGDTPALWAALFGYEGALRLMIEKKPDVLKDKDGYNGTPALVVARGGNEKVLMFMVERHPEVLKDRDNAGITPAMLAEFRGLEKALMLMLEKTPEVLKDKDNYGHTLARMAASEGHEKTLMLIYKASLINKFSEDEIGLSKALNRALKGNMFSESEAKTKEELKLWLEKKAIYDIKVDQVKEVVSQKII